MYNSLFVKAVYYERRILHFLHKARYVSMGFCILCQNMLLYWDILYLLYIQEVQVGELFDKIHIYRRI